MNKRRMLQSQENDCYQTVLACLMDLPVNQVPNFHLLYFEGSREKRNLKKLTKKSLYTACRVESLWTEVKDVWLASHGLVETPIDNITHFRKTYPRIHVMMTGKNAKGEDHVVILEPSGGIWDPATGYSKCTLRGKKKFTYSYLANL